MELINKIYQRKKIYRNTVCSSLKKEVPTQCIVEEW